MDDDDKPTALEHLGTLSVVAWIVAAFGIVGGIVIGLFNFGQWGMVGWVVLAGVLLATGVVFLPTAFILSALDLHARASRETVTARL